MNKFGDTSKERLETCNWRLQDIHNHAIGSAPYDYGIACGYRSDEQQQKEYDEGDSNAKPGESAHNMKGADGQPSSGATDIYLYYDGKYWWGDEDQRARDRMRETMRYLQGVAIGLGYKLDVMPTLRGGVEDLGHCELA